MPDEIVALVDEQNRVIGSAPRSRMRAERLLHRATYVFVFHPAGELYVQKRTLTKDVYPGYRDPCAGGVVLAGESYEESARRELAEELGIRAVALATHGDFLFEDAESRVWGRIFSCAWGGALHLQASEVASVELMPVAQILREGAAGGFTPDGLVALRRLPPGAGRP